jgi:RND family efflux transporter MFP subunit
MSRESKRILLILGILAGAVGIALALITLRGEPPKKEREELAMLVDVLSVEPVSVNFRVRSQGTVAPRTQTELSAEVSGIITSVSPKFIAGGLFRAGETLMRIDPTNYEVAVDQADALVAQRQIEYDGASKLRSQGYRAESEHAAAKAALASARAELVRARRNLERTYVRLPFDGMVRSKDADLGQYVGPNSRLGVVFATDHAEVRLPLTDADLAFVELPSPGAMNDPESTSGPAVTLSTTQKGKHAAWEARIARSEGVVDEKSRVTYAVARVDDPYALKSGAAPLPMGTFVEASIQGSVIENIIRVPANALRGSNQLVFVDDDDRLRIRDVEIVRTDADFVYLTGGAAAGDRIVVTSLESPVNGTKVRVAGAE